MHTSFFFSPPHPQRTITATKVAEANKAKMIAVVVFAPIPEMIPSFVQDDPLTSPLTTGAMIGVRKFSHRRRNETRRLCDPTESGRNVEDLTVCFFPSLFLLC